MAETWTISVGGRVYGPYTLEQMQAFHAEKRLADYSLVARANEEQYHPAIEDAALASLFQPAPKPQAEDDFVNDPVIEPVHERSSGPAQLHRFGARAEPENGPSGPSHFVIVANMKSGSIAGLEEEIFKLGQTHRFTTQAWVLVSGSSLNIVRNALVQKLGKLDTLFIADATHDKAAWFNFGPETDTRVRRMWSRPVEYTGIEKRAAQR
jgi:hypothetical protein